jgi:hypothetical protein
MIDAKVLIVRMYMTFSRPQTQKIFVFPPIRSVLGSW